MKPRMTISLMALVGATAIHCAPPQRIDVGLGRVPEQSDKGAEELEPEEQASDVPVNTDSVAEEKKVQLALFDGADRSDADKLLDAQRKPVETVEFFQIAPKMRVADLAAGGGYTTELLARAVGSGGVVFGQNSPFILEHFAEVPWSARLAKAVMQNVVRIDTEFDSPLTGEASNLDAVVMVLFYHDTVWFKTDRAAMNQAIYSSLKPGGIYGIIDHASNPGAGIKQAQTLHRIEESFVVKEVEAAGFIFEESATFLRNGRDKRDWNASPSAAGQRRGTSDRFVLRFRKPAQMGRQQETPAPSGPLTMCKNPRPEMCTRQYDPVCGVIDTGVRCIAPPCPSTIFKTFGNACTACSNKDVIGHHPKACPGDASE